MIAPSIRPGADGEARAFWMAVNAYAITCAGEPIGTWGALAVDIRDHRAALVRVHLESVHYFIKAFDIAQLEALRPVTYVIRSADFNP